MFGPPGFGVVCMTEHWRKRKCSSVDVDSFTADPDQQNSFQLSYRVGCRKPEASISGAWSDKRIRSRVICIQRGDSEETHWWIMSPLFGKSGEWCGEYDSFVMKHTLSASGLEDGITSPIIQSYFYPLWQKLFHRLTARRHFRSQMCGFVRVYKKPVPVYTVNLACKGCFSQIAHHFYFSRCEQHLLLFALSRNDAICCFFTLESTTIYPWKQNSGFKHFI